jgi:hypothetical protein
VLAAAVVFAATPFARRLLRYFMANVSRRTFGFLVAAKAIALLAAGCRLITPAEDLPADERPTLLAPLAGDDHISLEVFFVHVPLGDERTAESIWNEVDEQQFSVETRGRLAQHGFRVGVASGAVPQTIQALLDANGSTSAAEESDSTDTGESQPLASRQELRLRPGGKGEIVPCPPRDSLTLMTVEGEELTGRTLHAAQGRFIVRCQAEGDGRVRVALAPQIQHGEVRRRFVGGDGAFRPDIGQDKIEFDRLAIATVLSPGQMIVAGALPAPLSSLARDFLTDNSSGKPVQKLLVLRLMQSQYDDALAAVMADEQ